MGDENKISESNKSWRLVYIYNKKWLQSMEPRFIINCNFEECQQILRELERSLEFRARKNNGSAFMAVQIPVFASKEDFHRKLEEQKQQIREEEIHQRALGKLIR